MSATGRSDVRHPDDFYRTPAWATHALLRWLTTPNASGGHWSAGTIFDPCAGDGGILDAVRSYPAVNCDCHSGPTIFRTRGIEINKGRAKKAQGLHPAVVQRDALEPLSWGLHAGEIVVANPPYALAMDFVQRAIRERVEKTVIMLLRLNWLASVGRSSWLRANTPSVLVLPKRPSFCQSVSCKGKKLGCTWHTVLALTDKAPRICPTCGAGVQITTSDAADYGWMVWDSVAPTVTILDCDLELP